MAHAQQVVAAIGIPGVTGHVYTTPQSLSCSVEKEFYLAYADSCTTDDFFGVFRAY